MRSTDMQAAIYDLRGLMDTVAMPAFMRAFVIEETDRVLVTVGHPGRFNVAGHAERPRRVVSTVKPDLSFRDWAAYHGWVWATPREVAGIDSLRNRYRFVHEDYRRMIADLTGVLDGYPEFWQSLTVRLTRKAERLAEALMAALPLPTMGIERPESWDRFDIVREWCASRGIESHAAWYGPGLPSCDGGTEGVTWHRESGLLIAWQYEEHEGTPLRCGTARVAMDYDRWRVPEHPSWFTFGGVFYQHDFHDLMDPKEGNDEW